MAKPDPLLSLLRSVEFLPLRVPRAGVQPLMLASHSGKELILLGHLEDALAPGAAPPRIARDIHLAGAIEQTRSSRIRLNAGLQILGNILSGITGNSVDLSQEFAGASSLTVQFSGVSVDRADLVMVDRYLSASQIHPESRHVRDRMLAGECAVLTATARCQRYVISAQRQDGADVELSVPLLRQAAGGALRVETWQGDSSRICYEGPEPVTFGVQAARIFFDSQGRFSAFKSVKPGQAVVRGLTARAPEPEMIAAAGLFVDVVDGPWPVAA